MQLPDGFLLQILSILARITGAVGVMLIGRWLARVSRKWSEQVMTKANLPPAIQSLLSRILRLIIMSLALLVALGVLGVSTMALLLGLAVIVLVLAIAMQQSLSDFSATVWFYSYSPFKVGDLIETQGIQGGVQELSDNGIVLAVRPYARLQDYWAVRADLVEQAKLRFDAEGISLSLPRQEVHLFEHAPRSVVHP